MDKDTTIEALRDEYQILSDQLDIIKRSVAREVQKFRRELIERRSAAARADFAKKLADAYQAGNLGVSDISGVIGTHDWSRVRGWRDLAGIPARGEARKVLEAANSPFRWAPDYSTLTVVKNSVGAEIEPVIYDMSTLEWNRPDQRWWANTGSPEQNLISDEERAAKKDDRKFGAFVSDEIQRKIDNKEIEEP